MRRDPQMLLYDVAAALAGVRDFCRGKTVADYESSLLLRSACERQLEIIGEAMMRLRDEHPEVYGAIPDGRAIIGFRNRLVHGYDSVDTAIVWDVIQTKLPALDAAVRVLLSDEP